MDVVIELKDGEDNFEVFKDVKKIIVSDGASTFCLAREIKVGNLSMIDIQSSFEIRKDVDDGSDE